MIDVRFKEIAELIKNIIFSPAMVFMNIRKGKYAFAISLLFLFSGLITFLKSFGIDQQKMNFFQDQRFNEIISFFNIPQVKWLFSILCYFALISIIIIFCKIVLKSCRKKDLLLSMMAISILGILVQAIFFLLQVLLPHKYLFILSNLVFIWVIYLSVLAIKISQNTSVKKSIAIYFLSGIPVFLFIGLPGLAPYLSWVVTG